MTTEPVETLNEIMALERFAIEATEHLGPFGPDIDRVCYHLHEDLMEDESHQDQEEVYHALIAAGVSIERDALADYPYEIWERRWPTRDWLQHDVPRIFAVMNRFNHGLYAISYEPKGSAADLYAAAFRYAWDHADPETRPPGCEEEDMSKKAAWPIFITRLRNTVYDAVRARKVSISDAVQRMDSIAEELKLRWPNKAAEAESMMMIGKPIGQFTVPPFGPEHEELLTWAVWQIVTDPIGKAN